MDFGSIALNRRQKWAPEERLLRSSALGTVGSTAFDVLLTHYKSAAEDVFIILIYFLVHFSKIYSKISEYN